MQGTAMVGQSETLSIRVHNQVIIEVDEALEVVDGQAFIYSMYPINVVLCDDDRSEPVDALCQVHIMLCVCVRDHHTYHKKTIYNRILHASLPSATSNYSKIINREENV